MSAAHHARRAGDVHQVAECEARNETVRRMCWRSAAGVAGMGAEASHDEAHDTDEENRADGSPRVVAASRRLGTERNATPDIDRLSSETRGCTRPARGDVVRLLER